MFLSLFAPVISEEWKYYERCATFYHFPVLWLITPHWLLEIGHGGDVHTMKISKFYKGGFWFLSFQRGGCWNLSVHHCLKSTDVKLPRSVIKGAASFTPPHTYWLHLPKAEVHVGLSKTQKGCEKLWKRPFHSFVSLRDSNESVMLEWDAEGEGHQTVPRTPTLWACGVVAEPHLAPNSPLTAVLPREAPQTLEFTHCGHPSWSPA